MTLLPPLLKKEPCACGGLTVPADLRTFAYWHEGRIVTKRECWRCRKREARRKEALVHGA